MNTATMGVYENYYLKRAIAMGLGLVARRGQARAIRVERQDVSKARKIAPKKSRKIIPKITASIT